MLAAEHTRFETIHRVADDVVIELERSGFGDEDDRRAAKLEVAFFIAFSVFFAAVRLDDGPHSERPDIHKPVASEIGVARENLPFIVGINVGASDERYRIYGMVLARNDADAFRRAACAREMESVVVDGCETYNGDVIRAGRCIVVEHPAKTACRALERERSVGIGVEIKHEPPVSRTDHAVADRTCTGLQPSREKVVE